MSESRFARLEDVVLDDAFPELDLALRRGRHVDRDDAIWYALLVDAQDHLEPLYRRYGCELVHKSDGYFYLLPTNDRLGKRHLSAPEMLVGQALALLYLDAATVETGGVVTRDQVLGHLAGVVGSDVLVRMMNPKRRRYDERVAAETVRAKVADALRRLSTMGFIDVVDESRYRLRASLLRFAEPLRGAGSASSHLADLVASGELVIDEEGADAGDREDEAEDGGDDDHADEDEVTDDVGAPDEDDATTDVGTADPDDAKDDVGAPDEDDAADDVGAPDEDDAADDVGAPDEKHATSDEEMPP